MALKKDLSQSAANSWHGVVTLTLILARFTIITISIVFRLPMTAVLFLNRDLGEIGHTRVGHTTHTHPNSGSDTSSANGD